MLRLYPLPAEALSSAAYDTIEYPDPPAGRPYVVLNFAVTLDGQATLGSRGAAGIGSQTDHRLMRELRATVDGLLHGAGTVRADNFAPVVRDNLVDRRLARGLAPQPLGSVVSRSGKLDPESRYFSVRPPLVFTVEAAAADLTALLGSRATVVVAGKADVDVRHMLGVMRAQFGIRSVLCEGGPRLAHSLLLAGCLDEIFLTLAPMIASDRGAARLVEGPAFSEAELPRLDLGHVLAAGSELFLRYRVRR